MSPNPNYFAFIPANVLYHKELSPSAKLLYCQITGLVGEQGFCWASNAFFAQRNECSEWTISNLISQLQRHGFLRVEINQSAGNQRRIYTAETAPLLRKTTIPSWEKSHEGIEKNPNTLLRKTPSRVRKSSNESELVKVSGENAPASQQPTDSNLRDTSMPSSGPAPRPVLFAESVWASESAETWRVNLASATNISDLDADWYLNRCKQWSATKGGMSADWLQTAASWVADDQRKKKLVTIQPLQHDNLRNPHTGNPTTTARAQQSVRVAQILLAREQSGL